MVTLAIRGEGRGGHLTRSNRTQDLTEPFNLNNHAIAKLVSDWMSFLFSDEDCLFSALGIDPSGDSTASEVHTQKCGSPAIPQKSPI